MPENEISSKKILSGVIWSYIERFSAQIVSMLVSVVLARLLDPEHYGIIAIVMVFINIMEVLITGGYSNALIQKKDVTDIDYHTIFWLNLGIGALEYLILFFGAPVIARFYEMPILLPVIRVLGLRVFLSAIYSVQSAFVQKNLKFRMFFFSTLGGTFFSAVVGIFLAFNGAGVWALVAQYMCSSLIHVCVLWFLISWHPRARFSFKSLKQMMNFGTAMFAATVITAFQDNIRSLFVGKKFNTETLAYYNHGKKYPQLLMSDIIGSIGKVLFPVLSAKDQVEESKLLMRNAVKIGSYILLPIILGLIAVADNFVLVLFTEKWSGCIVFMRILAATYLTRPISTIIQQGLLAAGKGNANLTSIFSCATLGLLLVIFATMVLEDAIMVAVTYVIVMGFDLLIRMYHAAKYLKYYPLEILKDFLPRLLLAAIACGGAYLFGFLNFNPLVSLICQILIGAILYLLLSFVLRVPEFQKCIELVRKIKAKK